MRASMFMVMGAAVAAPILAQSAGDTPQVENSSQGDLAITIYNDDRALIQDIRLINLPAGTSRQEFPDVSAAIRPETVSLTGSGFGIVEQNFDYDLLSPHKLMEKAVGQTVTLLRTNEATGAQTRERAKILAANDGVVLQIGNRIEILRDDGLPVRVIFDTVPPNLRASPTLSITVDADRAGKRPLTLSYLSGGLGWKADYVALFDEKLGKMDVQGWITLTNNTGTSFNNAKTLLVAGRVHRVQYGQGRNQNYRPQSPDAEPGTETGTETGRAEQLGDFYVYPIANRTMIANAQTKQVSFLDISGVDAAKGYEYRNTWLKSAPIALSAASVLKFSTSKQGGLGDALPAGTVRVYMRDIRGQSQFIGENRIDHVPGGSSLSLKTGEAFDVKVQPEMVNREKISSAEWENGARYRIAQSNGSSQTITTQYQREYWRTTMRYTVTNAKSEPVTVDVIQGGLNRNWQASDDRVVDENIKGNQTGLAERLWKVDVPANGTSILNVVFETRY